MKKRILIGTLIVFAAVALVVAFSGCDLVAYLTTDIDGRVVNAKSDGSEAEWWKYSAESDTLEGATVQLFAENSSGTGFETTAYETGTVSSSGTYSMLNVPTGRYKLTGDKTDWIFVPRVITISGSDAILPDLIAYPNLGGAVDNSVIIFLSWENLDHDLDGHLSYYDTTPSPDRYLLNPDNDSAYSGNLSYERDILDTTPSSYPRVETILISGHDFSTGGVSHSDDASVLSSPPQNQLRFYAHCFNSSGSISLTGLDGTEASAWGQVDVMYGETHFGTWILPYNTSEDTLWVVTIDALDSGQFTIYSANNANYMDPTDPSSFKNLDSNSKIAIPVETTK